MSTYRKEYLGEFLPAGPPGIDPNNSAQKRIVQLQEQNTVSLLRSNYEALSKEYNLVVEQMKYLRQYLGAMMEMAERDGIELTPISGTEVMALKEARHQMEQERNKTIDRVERKLGEEPEEEELR